MYGQRFLNIGISTFNIEWMDSCIERTIRPDIDMMTKDNTILIEDSKIEIGKKVITNLNIFAKVAMERRIDIKRRTRLSK